MKNRILRTVLLGSAILLASPSVFAGGWEKDLTWSGRWNGVAGASVSSVQGAEALYFNPAGLMSSGREKPAELTLQLSPTLAKVSAPNVAPNVTQTNENIIRPYSGLLYARKLNDSFAIGSGFYQSAANRTQFTDLDESPFPDKGTNRAFYDFNEFSLGVAYKVIDGLKIGAAWRVTSVNMNLSQSGTQLGPFIALDLNDMKATKYDGYRLGVQYDPNETWGVGVSYRSAVNFTAEGTSVGRYNEGPGGAGSVVGGPVTVTSQLPQALYLGGHYVAMPKLTLFAEYDYLNYSQVDQLATTGTFFLPNVGNVPIPSTTLAWTNENRYKIGAEYSEWAWPVRVGFVYGSQTVPDTYALSTGFPPAAQKTITIGTGHKCMDNRMIFDTAFEYTTSTGDGASGVTTTRAGTYSQQLYALHLGLSYLF